MITLNDLAPPSAPALTAAAGALLPPPPPVDTAVQHDGDGWVLSWRGRSWASDEVLVRHMALVEELSGPRVGWDVMRPYESPRITAIWLTVLLAEVAFVGNLDVAAAEVLAAGEAELRSACTRKG